MVRLVAVFFFLVAVCVYGYVPKPQQCGSNEVWNECTTEKFCEPKCGQDTPMFCNSNCVARCQCIKGYKRNLNTDLCVQNCEFVSKTV